MFPSGANNKGPDRSPPPLTQPRGSIGKAFYDFLVVSLDILAREFRECDARGRRSMSDTGARKKGSGQPAMNRSKQGRYGY
jgi:hypothetical protein